MPIIENLRKRFQRTESDGIEFRCNICGTHNKLPLEPLAREAGFCAHCGSTVRMRSIIDLLTSELLHKSKALPDIKHPHLNICGIGMSCAGGYAEHLSNIFN